MNRKPDISSAIDRAASLLKQADALIVAAGAGMGVDSGLPDFRGREGFRRAYPALRESGIDFYSIASPSAFVSALERAWGFYGHRLALYRKTVPHPGFELLKKWGQRMPHGLSVFTSNVDGHLQLSGFDPVHVHECHGSIHHLQCLQPCCEVICRFFKACSSRLPPSRGSLHMAKYECTVRHLGKSLGSARH